MPDPRPLEGAAAGARAGRAGYPSRMDPLSLSRRVFLGRALQLVGAAAVVPALACGPARPPQSAQGLQALAASELAILEAVAEAFVPSGGAFETGAREVDLARRIDALAAGQGPDVVRGLRGALWLVELLGGPLAGRFGRFSRLSFADREAVLRALVTSRLAPSREVFAGLKQLCVFTFYCQDASWPATGYDGPWRGRAASAA